MGSQAALASRLPRLLSSAAHPLATAPWRRVGPGRRLAAVAPCHHRSLATDFSKCGWYFQPGTGIAVQRGSKSTTLVLSSPDTLNALTLESAKALRASVDREDADRLFLIHSSGGPAMCAGGNVWAVAKDGPVPMEQKAPNLEFFRELFTLCSAIHKRKDTWIAGANGPALGMGMSMCVLGRACVVTNSTFFSMPETIIGLTPSAGGSYFLPRLPNSIGIYMGLTGARALARDALDLGMASHYLPEDGLQDLFSSAPHHNTPEGLLGGVLPKIPPTQTSGWRQNVEAIDRIFSLTSAEDINKALAEEAAGGGEHAEWAKRTEGDMKKLSPTSVAVGLECMLRGKDMSLDDCLRMDLRVTRHILARTDFLEGTRVRFGDRRGQTPNFAPPPAREQVLEFFEPMPADEELQL